MFQKWLWTTSEAKLLQKKTLSEGQKLWHFSYRGLQSTGQHRGHIPLARSVIREGHWAMPPPLGRQDSIISIE